MRAALENADLGTRFGDLRLNARVVGPNGQPLDVFSCRVDNGGNQQFRCNVCNIAVVNFRNIVIHLEGKKHNSKMAGQRPMGAVGSG